MSRSRTALLLPRLPVPHRRSAPGRRQAAPRPLPERVPSKDRSGPVRHPSGKVRSPGQNTKNRNTLQTSFPVLPQRRHPTRRACRRFRSAKGPAAYGVCSRRRLARSKRTPRNERERFHGIRFLRFFVGLCADTRSAKRIRHTAVRCNGLENRLPPHRTLPGRPEPARLRGKGEGFQKRTSTRSAA